MGAPVLVFAAITRHRAQSSSFFLMYVTLFLFFQENGMKIYYMEKLKVGIDNVGLVRTEVHSVIGQVNAK